MRNTLTGGTIGFVEAAGWESFSPWTTAMRVVSLVSWVSIVLADVALVRSPTFWLSRATPPRAATWLPVQ
jgi:hypothetical protein